jgi:hypothetical protein
MAMLIGTDLSLYIPLTFMVLGIVAKLWLLVVVTGTITCFVRAFDRAVTIKYKLG